MYYTNSNIYKEYIHYFCDNIFTLINKIVNTQRNIYKYKLQNTIKYYINLLTLNTVYYSNNICTKYLDCNYSLYYTVNIPIEFKFNNLKTFHVNYNIINIPKINQTGDLLLNGYFRAPILYLKLVTKYICTTINNNNIRQYLIKLKHNLNLYIYLNDNNINIKLHSHEILNSLFSIYNNIIFKNRHINFINLSDVIYISNLKDTKKYSVNNSIESVNYILYNIFNIEIFNVLNKFINFRSNKTFIISNDNLIHKLPISIFTSIFNYIDKLIIKFNIIRYFKNLHIKNKINTSLSTLLFKENLLTNPSIHYIDQLNILAYLTSKFKINLFGYVNYQEDTFSSNIDIRKIKSDYIGLINIINTPDGDMCGLVSYLTNNTIVDKYKLKLMNSTCSLSENFIYLDITSKNMNDIIITDFSNLRKNRYFKIKTIEILENNEFKLLNLHEKTQNRELCAFNILSITELIIPFLFNDDPCRGLMGSKMHTQALPLIYSENPYVVTKYNNVNNLLSSRYIYSLYNGIVDYVDNNRIIILDEQDRYMHIYLYPFNILDYNALVLYKPIVWVGEKIQVGKILAVPIDLKHLEFTLGFNNIVNYNFYNGYEHEDAIVINKNLLINDFLTSISFDVYEEYLSINKFDYIELTFSRCLLNSQYCRRIFLNQMGVLHKKNYLLSGDNLLTKVKYELSISKNKQLFKIFSLVFKHNKKLVTTNMYLKIDKGHEGRLIKYNITSYNKLKQSDLKNDNNISYLTLQFFIFRINRIKIGDKLCGRHGNKGVISKLAESIDLPYSFYDLYPYSITSPIGALARINLGQFLEGSCGYIGMYNDYRIKAPINLLNSYIYSNLQIKSLYNSFNKYTDFYFTFYNKNYLRDFKTGYKLKNYSLLSLSYYLKLMHTAKSKCQYRTVGSYSKMTQQPMQGKNYDGGQKFGEMEVWALESHGSSYNMRELMLCKTNMESYTKIKKHYKCSESFKLLTLELKHIFININANNKYRFIDNCIQNNC